MFLSKWSAEKTLQNGVCHKKRTGKVCVDFGPIKNQE
jgi:hypothetical protein